MNKKLLRLSLLSIACALMFGCATAVIGGVAAAGTTGVAVGEDPRGASGVVDDQELRSNVSDAISSMVAKSDVGVASYNGVVLLTGTVNNAANKSKAETVASQVPGVKGVRNYIEVGPSLSASQVSKDAYLTSAVKSSLLFTKGVSSNDVKVVTTNGVVYIMGYATQYQIDKMISSAKSVDGVRKVVSLLTVVN
ncbi:MAG: BON domain-containing protein [Neisseriaceae bacterium]|nr:MAG: BON domain-containing protein [Neisseriaceae bacterium]